MRGEAGDDARDVSRVIARVKAATVGEDKDFIYVKKHCKALHDAMHIC